MAAPCISAREHGQRADVGLRRILLKLLKLVRDHSMGVLLDVDIEELHDFRVGVRRSRVVAAIFAKTGVKKEIARYRKGLKWLGEVTGDCRDLDVLLAEFGELTEMLGDDEAVSQLRLMIAEDRQAAHQEVCDALRSGRFERWLRDWEQYLDHTPERLNGPVVDALAAVRIEKARTRVAEACAGEIDAAGLHRIRIRCKRLRYDLEIFREISEPQRAAESIAQLKRLQDVLGANHDAHVQQLRFSVMKNRPGVEDAVKVVIEELCQSLAQREEQLRVAALKELAKR